MFEPTLNERDRSVDWPMIIGLVGLMMIGTLFIYSATNVGESTVRWYRQPAFSQLIWYALGSLAAFGICLFPYHTVTRWALIAYWASILCLLLVFIWPERNGAHRWIDFGPAQFQPSEFAKLAVILALANFLSRPADELKTPAVFIQALALMALPFALIFKEPDFGSALVLLPVSLTMLFAAGVPLKYLARLLGVAAVLIVLLLVDVLFAPAGGRLSLKEYQRQRLLVYLGRNFAAPGATPLARAQARDQQRDRAHNVVQAMISVGSGGLTGKGWRQGTQNSQGWLPRPVAPNDFIFSVIAEESGFIGSVIVLSLYTVVFFCGIRIAGQARDRLGKLLAVGVVMLLFSHVFINIGMNIRLVPVTGIPLPLLSYGGSSVLCSLVAAGLLQNVYLYRRKY